MTDARAALDAAAARVVHTSGPDDGSTYAERDPAPYTALAAVLDLHYDREVWDGKQNVLSGTCNACSEREDTYDDIPWPCLTVRTISTALETS